MKKIPNKKGEMKMKVKKKVAILLVLVFLISILSIALPIAPVGANPVSTEWSVQYMIDQSQTVGYSQFSDPRFNRGLALSPDGRYLYAGYNNPNGVNLNKHDKQVRKIDTTVADYTDATVAILQGDRGKAIATDDKGRVYLAEGSDTDTKDGPGIHIYDANLATKLLTIGVGTGLTKPEGVAVTRENGQLVLYATDRSLKTLNRFLITEGPLTATLTATIAIGAELRGVEVDPDGRIWMAGHGGTVHRVNSTGTGLVSATIGGKPIDIGFCCGWVFVTQYETRTITVLNQDDLSVVDTLTPPWASLELDPDGQDSIGALSGIAVSSGAIYVANEEGQTANEHSTYGLIDSQSGYIGSKYYKDLTHDDNDPILKMVITTILEITASAGPGGSISPSGAVSMNYCGSQTFTITPDTGYRISDVRVDDVSVGQVSSYTFSAVNKDHTIAATFTQDEYTLTVNVVGGGSVTKNPDQAGYHYNDVVTLTATADLGWTFAGWSGDLTGTTNPGTVTIDGNKDVTATFIGPKTIKQNVLDDLTVLRATVTDKQDGKKLDEAIKHLTKSLDPELWTDETHLQAKHGDKVFNEEKDAVVKLLELIKDKKSAFYQSLTLQGFIDRLVNADRLLVSAAIHDAVTAGGDVKKIDKANEELSKGDARVSDNHFADAIEHYRNAWKHAIEAV
jgi:hypothetical protein